MNVMEMDALKAIVNQVFDTDINLECRKRHVVYARMAFAKIIRDTGYRLEVIGSYIKKDHATIIYYTNGFDNLMKQDEDLMRKYMACKQAFHEDRQPMKVDTKEERLQKRIKELTIKLDGMLIQSKRIEQLDNTYGRLMNIIKLIDSKTPAGEEEKMEIKIQRIFN